MWFSEDELEGLREFAKTQRELEETMTAFQVHINSELSETARTLNAFSEQKEELARNLNGFRAEQAQAAAALANSVPTEEYRAAASLLQEPLVPLETIRAVSETVEPLSRLATDLANNQAFLDAMGESVTMRSTVEELALISSTPGQIEERSITEIDSKTPTAAVYDQTANPYEPIQEELNQIESTITNYIWASVSDSGELSSDLSEEQKKAIRFGLAITVGLLIGTVLGLSIGAVAGGVMGMKYGIISGATTGLTSTISTSRWFSNEFDKWYDMKQRQDPPEDESE